MAGVTIKLTTKQERFCLRVAGGANQSDAYRAAYNAANCCAATVHKRSGELMRNRAIAGRIAALREVAAEHVRYDYQAAMRELETAMAIAVQCRDPGALVKAIGIRARISGVFIADRKNKVNIISGMAPAQVAAALRTLANMRGSLASASGTRGPVAVQHRGDAAGMSDNITPCSPILGCCHTDTDSLTGDSRSPH